MNITHDNQTQADLKGPMTELEFLEAISNIENSRVEFAIRTSSHRQSNRLSFSNEGWIVIQYSDQAPWPLLYDSIKSPSAYLSSTNLPGRVVGRHSGDNYWILNQ